MPIGQIRAAGVVAAIEHHAGTADHRQRMSPHPLEERHGFVELPLAAAQLAEPHQAFPRHRGTAGGELGGRRGELVLGFVPRPAPHADRRVLGAADGEQRPEPHPDAERFEAIAPLRRTLVVVDAFAGGNEVAAREADEHAIAQLAGQHRRVHLVELLQALGHRAGRDPREAVHRAADHLVVHGANRLADAHRL